MALTVCAYCDKTFLEQYPNCPHCGRAQMDMVQHALLVVTELSSKAVLEEIKRLESNTPDQPVVFTTEGGFRKK